MQIFVSKKHAAAVITAFALTTGAAFQSTVEAQIVETGNNVNIQSGWFGQGGNLTVEKDVTVGGKLIVNGEDVMSEIADAQNNAEDAKHAADAAMDEAKTAQGTAEDAKHAADAAMGEAKTAQGTANEALQKANENAAAIKDLENDMNVTQEVVSEIDNRVTDLENDMNVTQEVVSEIDNRLTNAESDIDSLENEMDATKATIGEIGSKTDANTTSIEEIKNGMGDVGDLTNEGTTLVEGINKNTESITNIQNDMGNVGDLTNEGTTLVEGINANTSMIQENTNRINALDRRVSDLSKDIDSVGAMATALAGLHPLDYDGTGSKFQLAAAVGTYDGAQALALGGFYHFNEDVMMSLGGAMTMDGNKERAWNVGFTVRVGQSGKKEAPVSADSILLERISEQDARIAELMAKVEALMAQEEE